MTTRTLCEATAMDVAKFGSWDDAVPPCGEPAAVDGLVLAALDGR